MIINIIQQMTNKEINDKAVLENEEMGRIIFTNICKRENWCKKHKEAKKRYSHWDVSFFDKAKDKQLIIGEIKTRDAKHDKYQDWYFELNKINELIEISRLTKEKTNEEPLIAYINIFTDNFMFIWYFTTDELIGLRDKTNLKPAQNNEWEKKLKLKPIISLTCGSASRKEEINLNLSILKNIE